MADPNEPGTPPPPEDSGGQQQAELLLEIHTKINDALKQRSASLSEILDLEIRLKTTLDDALSIKTQLTEDNAKNIRYDIEQLGARLKLIQATKESLGLESEEVRRQREMGTELQNQEQLLRRMGIAQKHINDLLEVSQKFKMMRHQYEDATSWAPAISAGLDKAASIANIPLANQMAAARGQVAALATGANVGGSPDQLMSRMFGGIPTGVMGPAEKMTELMSVLREAPKVAGESTASMDTLVGTLANFGLTVEESIAVISKASRESAMTAKDVAQTYMAANIISRGLGLSTDETAKAILEMTPAMRHFGGDAKTAQLILNNFSQDITAMGQKLSAVEMKRMAQSFAQGMGGMTLATAAGLQQFVQGTPIQSIRPSEDFTGPRLLELAKDTFDKIQAQVGGSEMEKYLATVATGQKLFGVNAATPQQAEQLYKIMSSGEWSKGIEEELKMMDPRKVQEEGLRKLTAMVGPLDRIAKATEGMQDALTRGVFPMLHKGVETLALMRLLGVNTNSILSNTMSAVGSRAAGSLLGGAAAGGAYGGAARVFLPAAATGGAGAMGLLSMIPGIGWAAIGLGLGTAGIYALAKNSIEESGG